MTRDTRIKRHAKSIKSSLLKMMTAFKLKVVTSDGNSKSLKNKMIKFLFSGSR
jgi:hypothetical protein